MSLKYIRVKWLHDHPDAPVLLYSEFDDERWETRKVEIFRDGRCGYAGESEHTDSTDLGDQPVPSLAEIGANPEFEPAEISQEEFEAVWVKRRG